MKKITLILSAVVLSMTFNPTESRGESPSGSDTVVVVKTAEMANADAILLRLHEIEAMDKSTLTVSEKKSLRKEVRSLEKEAKSSGNGLYISIAALIIIILLLIIIL